MDNCNSFSYPDTAFLIADQEGDYELARTKCQDHCESETDLKSFYGLKRKQMFTHSCICLSALPGDSGLISK